MITITETYHPAYPPPHCTCANSMGMASVCPDPSTSMSAFTTLSNVGSVTLPTASYTWRGDGGESDGFGVTKRRLSGWFQTVSTYVALCMWLFYYHVLYDTSDINDTNLVTLQLHFPKVSGTYAVELHCYFDPDESRNSSSIFIYIMRGNHSRE